MDAKCTPWTVWGCSLLMVGGCAWLQPDPAARRETAEPAAPAEPPQVVVAKEVENADPVQQDVGAWMQRLDKAEQIRPADTAAPSGPPPSSAEFVTLIADPDPNIEPVPQPPPPPVAPATPSPATPGPEPAIEVTMVPPTLDTVTVHAAPNMPVATTETAAPGINKPAVARGGPASLRDFLEQSLPSEEGSFREQLDRRILWVVAGDYERARQPLSLVTAEQQELASRFVEAWVVIRECHMGDPTRAATVAARELEALQKSLQRVSELSIPTVKLCSAVRSYGQYDAIEPARFPAGSGAEFVLYCEVSDFVSEPENELYTTRFDMTTTILNRIGDTVLEIKDTEIVDRCRNRRHDCFIPRLVRLPETLPPGQYVAKVTVIDKLGQKVAEGRAPFQLVARP